MEQHFNRLMLHTHTHTLTHTTHTHTHTHTHTTPTHAHTHTHTHTRNSYSTRGFWSDFQTVLCVCMFLQFLFISRGVLLLLRCILMRVWPSAPLQTQH